MRLLTSATARCYCSLLLHLCYCSLLLLLLPAASINGDRLPPRCTHSIRRSPHPSTGTLTTKGKGYGSSSYTAASTYAAPAYSSWQGSSWQGSSWAVSTWAASGGKGAAAKGKGGRAAPAAKGRGGACPASHPSPSRLEPYHPPCTHHHIRPLTAHKLISGTCKPTKPHHEVAHHKFTPQSHTTKSLFFFD